jgi:hypothetical protein
MQANTIGGQFSVDRTRTFEATPTTTYNNKGLSVSTPTLMAVCDFAFIFFDFLILSLLFFLLKEGFTLGPLSDYNGINFWTNG